MKITLRQYNNKVSITTNNEELTLPEVVEELIEPALLALGYHPATIAEVLYGDTNPIRIAGGITRPEDEYNGIPNDEEGNG